MSAEGLDSSHTVWTNEAITRAVDYDYDAVGNLVRKSDFGATYHYGNGSRSAGANAGPHAVRRVDLPDGGAVTDFQYDDVGNMTAGVGRTIVYDVFNKPVQITEGSRTTYFRYGPDLSLFVRQGNDSTTYYGDGYQLVVAADGAQTERTYIGQHVVVERSNAGRKVRYQHLDRLGSLVLVTDEEGNATETRGFDPFGKPLDGDWQDNGGLLHSSTTGMEQLTEHGYTGHEHLDDHKLIHMDGRVYDPLLGRVLSVDPFIQSETSTQSQNAYSYVMNNPLSMIDPSGYQACKFDGPGSCLEVGRNEVYDRNGKHLGDVIVTDNGKKGQGPQTPRPEQDKTGHTRTNEITGQQVTISRKGILIRSKLRFDENVRPEERAAILYEANQVSARAETGEWVMHVVTEADRDEPAIDVAIRKCPGACVGGHVSGLSMGRRVELETRTVEEAVALPPPDGAGVIRCKRCNSIARLQLRRTIGHELTHEAGRTGHGTHGLMRRGGEVLDARKEGFHLDRDSVAKVRAMMKGDWESYTRKTRAGYLLPNGKLRQTGTRDYYQSN